MEYPQLLQTQNATKILTIWPVNLMPQAHRAEIMPAFKL